MKDFITSPVTEARRNSYQGPTKTERDATAELKEYFENTDWDWELYYAVLNMLEYRKKRIAGNDMMTVIRDSKHGGGSTSLWGMDEDFLKTIAKKLQSATYDPNIWKKY